MGSNITDKVSPSLSFSFLRTDAFTGKTNSPSLVGKILVFHLVFPIVTITLILPKPLAFGILAAFIFFESVLLIVKKCQAALSVLYFQSFVLVR